MAGDVRLTKERRALFAEVADFLLPAYRKMPAASAAGVQDDMLDTVLRFRPDLVDGFFRGLDKLDSGDIAGSANALFRDDPDAFGAVSLAASGGYYMTPVVRDALGYPGQESLKYDPHEVPDYMMDGLLERVVQRGTIYKPTPR